MLQIKIILSTLDEAHCREIVAPYRLDRSPDENIELVLLFDLDIETEDCRAGEFWKSLPGDSFFNALDRPLKACVTLPDGRDVIYMLQAEGEGGIHCAPLGESIPDYWDCPTTLQGWIEQEREALAESAAG